MEPNKGLITPNIAGLKVSASVKQGIEEFVSHVVDSYAGDLVSVTAFGSVVTGDYDEGESDVNLLIIHSDLDIADLERVAALSRRWLKKQKLAPRFLSRRNLEQSAPYFQIDFLDMRDAHVVLCGEDVLAGIKLEPAQLRWQIAYEVKAMRMRIKQMYWRAAGDNRMMKSVLTARFTSLLHLVRGLLLLKGLPAPVTRREIIGVAAEHLGLDRQPAERLLELRQSKKPPDREPLLELFNGLMEMIRVVDASVEEVKV